MLKNNKFNRFLLRNNYVLRNSPYINLAVPKSVNLNAWIVPNSNNQNVGDYLSVEIVQYMCNRYGVDANSQIEKKKHLYAIGSILLGYQDATIWGSGFGYNIEKNTLRKVDAFIHKHYHKLDVRAVRGPETRRILLEMGYDCPEIYGDPAVLTPLLYNKTVKKQREYVIIPHYSKLDAYRGRKDVLGTFTNNYKNFIDKFLQRIS